MIETADIPTNADLRRLASQVKVYPISGLGIVQLAEHLGHPDSVIKFTKLFSGKMIFWSRTDFLNYCLLLKGILKEEEKAPSERPQSPGE